MNNNTKNRETILPQNSQFITRWSPRSFDVNYQISKKDMDMMLEAARWSYSSNNNQPWTFVYGLNGDETFKKIFNTLMKPNQIWAKNLGALIVVLNNKDSSDADILSTGAATMSISLQAQEMGLHTHLFGGYFKDKIEELTGDDFKSLTIIGVGKMGDMSDLDEFNKARETPSGRKSLDEIAFSSFDGLKN